MLLPTTSHHTTPPSTSSGAELTLSGRPLGDVWLAGDEQQYHDARPDLSLHPAGSMNKQAGHW